MISLLIIMFLLYVYIKGMKYAFNNDVTGYQRRKEYERKKAEKERSNNYKISIGECTNDEMKKINRMMEDK